MYIYSQSQTKIICKRPSKNCVTTNLFLFLLFVNILLLKSNLTAPGVEVENLKEKVSDKDQDEEKEQKNEDCSRNSRSEIRTWPCTGWWCCPGCPRTSRTSCRCWRCRCGSNSSPQILTLKWRRPLSINNGQFQGGEQSEHYSFIFDAEIKQFPSWRLYIDYHRGKMRRPNTGAKTECWVSILCRRNLVTLMHSCRK